MLIRGVLDSPPNQSENLRLLQAIEDKLRINCDKTDWEDAMQVDHEEILHDLWGFLVDVVCTPLWLRLRAAELLNMCYTLRQEYLRVDQRHCHWIRAIVSSTCQILDELNPQEQAHADALFHWMVFLEHILVATDDSTVFSELFEHALYTRMLHKMMRLLGQCSTQLFAATTISIVAFHRHEVCIKKDENKCSVLLEHVLDDPAREGVQHFGEALLHVLNSCGCPCPDSRRTQLEDTLCLLLEIVGHSNVEQILYLNDFKVLIDIVIRELSDLPLEDPIRYEYVKLLDRVVASSLFLHAQKYRHKEVLRVVEEMTDALGSGEDEKRSQPIFLTLRQILIKHIDRLD